MTDFENKVLLRGKVKGPVRTAIKSNRGTAFFCIFVCSFHCPPGGKDYVRSETIPLSFFGNDEKMGRDTWETILKLKDGDEVEVEGRLHNYKQEKDGVTEFKLSVIGHNVKILNS